MHLAFINIAAFYNAYIDGQEQKIRDSASQFGFLLHNTTIWQLIWSDNQNRVILKRGGKEQLKPRFTTTSRINKKPAYQ